MHIFEHEPHRDQNCNVCFLSHLTLFPANMLNPSNLIVFSSVERKCVAWLIKKCEFAMHHRQGVCSKRFQQSEIRVNNQESQNARVILVPS